MELEEFVAKFANEMSETPVELVTPETDFKNLAEWGSLSALSIVSMIDEEYDKMITGADLRSIGTIKELYEFVESL